MIFALVLMLPVLVCADDIKMADGQILHAKVTRVDPDGLVVETDAGVEKIDFVRLSDEAQKKYGYDRAKEEQYRKEQAARQQQRVQQQIASIRAQQASLENKQNQQPAPEEAERNIKVKQTLIYASGSVVQGTSKGSRVDLQVQTGEAARTMLGKDTRTTTLLGVGFIYGLEAADGESWSGRIFPAGYYHFTDEYGLERTIKAYALTVEDAIAHGATGNGPVVPSRDPATAPRLPGGLRGGTALDH